MDLIILDILEGPEWADQTGCSSPPAAEMEACSRLQDKMKENGPYCLMRGKFSVCRLPTVIFTGYFPSLKCSLCRSPYTADWRVHGLR